MRAVLKEQELQTLVTIAKEAGEVLLAGWETRPGCESKAALQDLVTDFDRRSEALLMRRLAEAFPDCGIVGEEGGLVLKEENSWVLHVDPLDGTINFTHGLPLFSVSIGVIHRGVPIAGVVHAPVLDMCFYGGIGLGARRNGKDIRVSGATSLLESLLVTGFTSTRPTPSDNIPEYDALNAQSRGVRRLGSAALDLAAVASGWLDGFWERHLKTWDIAGGAALVLAAGGTVSDLDGSPMKLESGRVLATNGLIHESLSQKLHEVAARNGFTWP